jgi:hypothetical protein
MDIKRVAAKRYWREADAMVVLVAWRASGMSLAGFARLHGCSSVRLGRWAARIAAGDAAEGSKKSGAVGAADRIPPPRPLPSGLRFVELVRPTPVSSPLIEVALGRAVVRVPAGFDITTFQKIVAALEASC